MRIEEDIKLGFKDVLIRPKRSILKSRSQVNLARCFSFKYSASIWSGIPIIAVYGLAYLLLQQIWIQ